MVANRAAGRESTVPRLDNWRPTSPPRKRGHRRTTDARLAGPGKLRRRLGSDAQAV